MNKKNCYIWAEERLQELYKVQKAELLIIFWCAMIINGIISPRNFDDDTSTGGSYKGVLLYYFFPNLQGSPFKLGCSTKWQYTSLCSWCSSILSSKPRRLWDPSTSYDMLDGQQPSQSQPPVTPFSGAISRILCLVTFPLLFRSWRKGFWPPSVLFPKTPFKN